MKHGLVLMTALLPTKGHEFLIDFGAKFMKEQSGLLHVLICTRSFESVKAEDRISAFQQLSLKYDNVMIHHLDNDNVPQNPSDHPDFWDVWKNICVDTTHVPKFSYIFASEKYGNNMADVLNCQFITCDIARLMVPISSTEVRRNIQKNFGFIMSTMQKYFRKKITMFGAESTGKTTMTKKLHSIYPDSYIAPEWAREYLETVGSELNDEKMNNIVVGQYSIQKRIDELKDKPLIFQDTDLLSTIGYYKIYGGKSSFDIEKMFQETKSDLYVVMNDQIPFEEDILRYGGNERESKTQFWVDLLEEYGCNYHIVKRTSKLGQLLEISNKINELFEYSTISNFERE